MYRTLIYLATNFAIILVLFLIWLFVAYAANVYGWNLNIGWGPGDYAPLLVFCFIFGMGGSFLSLQISRWSARKLTKCRLITEAETEEQTWLVETVRRLTNRVDLAMPQVGIFPGGRPNAFATGPSRNKALVAVNESLLAEMNRDEIEAVLAHEISHIKNGDMVFLCLIQGILNTFVYFFARVIGMAIDAAVSAKEKKISFGLGYHLGTIVAQIFLSILASIVVFWFSRKREFIADRGAAQLAGREKMVSALKALQRAPAQSLPQSMAAFGISGKKGDYGRLFMTHPPLEDRIRALEEG